MTDTVHHFGTGTFNMCPLDSHIERADWGRRAVNSSTMRQARVAWFPSSESNQLGLSVISISPWLAYKPVGRAVYKIEDMLYYCCTINSIKKTNEKCWLAANKRQLNKESTCQVEPLLSFFSTESSACLVSWSSDRSDWPIGWRSVSVTVTPVIINVLISGSLWTVQ